jgi:hypothetical protein
VLRSKRLHITLPLGYRALDRLTQPFHFEMERAAARLGTQMRLFQRLNIDNWIGRLIVLAQGHYPIYLTARCEAD